MNAKCFFTCLTVGCWNIEGLYEKINGVRLCKLEDPLFLKTLDKYDILCLQETHVSVSQDLPIPEGFKATPHCRKISSNNRYFGGFLVLVRKYIAKEVKIGKYFDEDAIQVTLLKHFLD